jgi:hypothetical protein
MPIAWSVVPQTSSDLSPHDLKPPQSRWVNAAKSVNANSGKPRTIGIKLVRTIGCSRAVCVSCEPHCCSLWPATFHQRLYHARESRSYIHDLALTLISAQMASSSFNVGWPHGAMPISCVMRILRAYLHRLYFVSKCTIRNGARALHLSNLCAIAKRRCNGGPHSSEAVKFVRFVRCRVCILTLGAQTET